MASTFTYDIAEVRCEKLLYKFLIATSARNGLMTKIRNFPKFVDHFKIKAFKARKSLKRKRNFLSKIF